MKIVVEGEEKNVPAVWFDDNNVVMINQSKIPHKITLFRANTYQEVVFAIKNMIIRGAPTIGATAAYGLCLAVLEYEAKNHESSFVSKAYNELLSSRPTAIDLKEGLDVVWNSIQKKTTFQRAITAAVKFVKKITDEAFKISINGLRLLERSNDVVNVLTHCNTGPLATVDHGTALGPLLKAHEQGKKIHVFVDETRPRLQGARITTFELKQAGVPFTLITDNTAGWLMKNDKIDLVIVGADRVVSNGDFANKIGTYSLAVLCKYHNIPFYTAFPSSTYDNSLSDGSKIDIELRNQEEVIMVNGMGINGELQRVRISPKNIKAINYAFDVTGHSLVTGYVTPIGILSRGQLCQLKQ